MKNQISFKISGKNTIENVVDKEYSTNATVYDFLNKVIEVAKETGYELGDVHLVFNRENGNEIIFNNDMIFVNIEDKTDFCKTINFEEQ